MASLLFAAFAAAAAVGASAGFLRGAAVPISEPLPPSPPIHQMVIIPYESPEKVSEQLRRMAKAREIDQCLTNETVLVPYNNLFIPIPPPKHHHLFKQYHRTHKNATHAHNHQLV